MGKGYMTDMFKQLEEITNKLDKALKKIEEQSLTIYNLNLNVTKLEKTIQEKDEKIKLLIEENEKLKNQINKNSNNSSKPSSTNIVTPKKKTGANLYNYRIKTGKKQGGQVGHKPHNLGKKEIEKLIDNGQIEVKNITHFIKGNSKRKPIIKYKLELEIKPYVEKHIFKYSKKSNDKLPKEYYTDVTYGTSIKTLSVHLGCYNVIAYNRLSDFFSVITKGIVKISTGTLVNFVNEFGRKSGETIEVLENNFLNGRTGFTDETSSKFNGKKLYVRNYSNEENVVYKMHTKKGHDPIKEDNILTRFCGGIMGDHDTTLYSYGTKNYECNIHVGRYLMELMENIPDTKWPFLMYDLIFRMNNTRKIAMEYKLDKFADEKIQEYKDEYDDILAMAKEENKKIKSSYYRIKKAIPLYNRLVKYKQNHLYFIEDFNIPFDDNLSEQDLRIFKNKTKISGGFRSKETAQSFSNALSIIKTSIKRGINPFDSVEKIFDGQVLFN